MILNAIPYNTVPPRYCQNTVMIDHFKFINGLRRYLFKRIQTYREMNLEWYIWLPLPRFFTCFHILLGFHYLCCILRIYYVLAIRWRDSARFLHFIKLHRGICVDCVKSGCVHAKTGKAVETVPNKVCIYRVTSCINDLF